ncbi:MAG: sulfatase-like hydrolase/transferase, partial [Verrucomicrobiae bacterium]|nr:sulfatase-like hydrolase/transferase [Verrucomicrobiae bacterium]
MRSTLHLPRHGVGWPALAMFAVCTAVFAASKPNILLILTDQQHGGMLSCAGNPWVKTPSLDGLAAGGFRFARAYVSNPVCVPSRFSLMTGRLPSVVGIEDNADQSNPVPQQIILQSLGHVFRRAGYCTAYAGKKHLPGQDGVREQVRAYGLDVHLVPRDYGGREQAVEACVRFSRQPPGRPFLCVMNTGTTHEN